MQIEHCPVFGLFCVTTRTKFNVDSENHFIAKEILMIESVTFPKDAKLIPIRGFIQTLNQLEHKLKQCKTHPTDAMAIGIPVEMISTIEVVMARVDRKQRDWVEADISTSAETEVLATRAAMARLRPIADLARKNQLSAEELIQSLAAEPDQVKARNQFLAQEGIGVTVHDENEVLVFPHTGLLPKKYAASKIYSLKVIVTSLDVTTSTIRLVIVETPPSNPFFNVSDIGVRAIITRAADEGDLRRLNLCMAYQVKTDVELAMSVNIASNGLTYSAAFIRFTDPIGASRSIREAILGDHQDLFDAAPT